MIKILAPLCLSLTLIILPEAQAAFRRSDLESFQSLRDPVTREVMRNVQHRPAAYFRANPATVWAEQNRDEEVALAPYLSILNGATTSAGTVLTFTTTGLSTNGQGRSVFSSLSQLLSSLVGGGVVSVPGAVEALPEAQSLLSTVNTHFITQQTQDGLFSTFGLRVTNATQQSFPTIPRLISSATGFVSEGATVASCLSFVNSYMVSSGRGFSSNGYYGFYIRRSSVTIKNGDNYNTTPFTSLQHLLGSITTDLDAQPRLAPSVGNTVNQDSRVILFVNSINGILNALNSQNHLTNNSVFTSYIVLFFDSNLSSFEYAAYRLSGVLTYPNVGSYQETQ